MTENKNIPKHWKVVKVGEYVISVKGKKPKRVSPIKSEDCSIPYVNIKAFEKGVIDEYTDGVGCVLCEEGDFLMVWDGSRSGYVGKAIKGALGSTLVKLRFPNIDINYVYYFLQSKFIEINTRAKGVGIPHVDPNLLWNYKFPIPPLPEQLAIVSKIEELFSELDNGKQQLLTAQQQLKVYRQSLLKAAFEGKLTAGWREVQTQKVNNGMAIAAEPEAKFGNNGELPEGWKWVKLNDIIISLKNGFSKKPDDEGENKILRISSVRPSSIDILDVRYLKSELAEDFEVIENDLLFTRYNGSKEYVGVCARVPKLTGKLFYPDKLIRCRLLQKEHFHSKFVQFALNCGRSRTFIQSKLKTTAGQTGISGGELKQIPIPIAPLKEQQIIILELERNLTVCDKIEETISQSLRQAETLRQSILKKAFEGKLV